MWLWLLSSRPFFVLSRRRAISVQRLFEQIRHIHIREKLIPDCKGFRQQDGGLARQLATGRVSVFPNGLRNIGNANIFACHFYAQVHIFYICWFHVTPPSFHALRDFLALLYHALREMSILFFSDSCNA